MFTDPKFPQRCQWNSREILEHSAFPSAIQRGKGKEPALRVLADIEPAAPEAVS